ncbi:SIMPL domain-containing protein [Candidatus Giovannonibacteria bacterium]|nr:SIMPL domain-containing protein [Candidatus Giovannonibacteria bacterium]
MENDTKNLNIRPPKEVMWTATVFLVVLIVFFAVKTSNEFAGISRNIPPSTISVAGEGKVIIKPDIALINIGVIKSNVNLLLAQREATEAINKINDTLKKNGVLEKDIKTTAYNISPRYDYKNGEQRFKDYEVHQNLEVKVRDLGKVGEVLSAVTAAGANQVGALSFTVDDPKKAQADARTLAIKDAKAKAEKLAGDLDVRLKKIVSFSESGGYPPPIYARKEIYGVGGATDIAPSPQVPTGENEILINVTITYEIR